MAPLQRNSSMNTALSTASKALSVPYTRRRVTPEQLKALNKLFSAKSHPSREDRAILANEMDMELKTVTNWFQNKRQTSKKRSAVWKENSCLKDRQLSRSASAPLKNARRLHPTISLDSIAGLHEKPAGPTVATVSQRLPLTPHKTNQRSYSSTDKTDLWEHMPSSPIAPPSSPGAESFRFSALRFPSQTRKSLEWACAKARAGKQGEDNELLDIAEVDQREESHEMETDDETETEVEEAVTPDGSANLSPGFSYKDKQQVVLPGGKENVDPNLFPEYHPSEDVEAAMVLLGFMGRS